MAQEILRGMIGFEQVRSRPLGNVVARFQLSENSRGELAVPLLSWMNVVEYGTVVRDAGYL